MAGAQGLPPLHHRSGQHHGPAGAPAPPHRQASHQAAWLVGICSPSILAHLLVPRTTDPRALPAWAWSLNCRAPAASLPPLCSRLAGRRVVFQPYSKDQLVTIVRSRLGACRGDWVKGSGNAPAGRARHTMAANKAPATEVTRSFQHAPRHLARLGAPAAQFGLPPASLPLLFCFHRGHRCLPPQFGGVHCPPHRQQLGRCAALLGAVP